MHLEKSCKKNLKGKPSIEHRIQVFLISLQSPTEHPYKKITVHHTKKNKKLWIVYGFALAAESDIGVEWKAAQKKSHNGTENAFLVQNVQ